MVEGHPYTIAICWDSMAHAWRWKCMHEACDNAWHPTTCAEQDYPGCVKTAALTHADAAHPDDGPEFDDLGECPVEATQI